jgi:glycosyltransferase involved in cell wall biosynthesis
VAVTPPRYDIIIPTIGRPSLATLLDELAGQPLPERTRVIIADDRRGPADGPPLAARVPPAMRSRTVTVGGRGPAAARNAGWRASDAPWIVFLDDDVVPTPGWATELASDLASAAAGTAAVHARIVVPQPTHRRATDRERNVARLSSATWITADVAIRRRLLVELGGFDERFPRAYREDTDFQLRAEAAGWVLEPGGRVTRHPPGAAPWWASIAAQRGNADDALLRALHGPAALDRGRRPRHQLVAFSGALALGAGVARRRGIQAVAGAVWLLGSAELAAARIRPGPRTPREMVAMVVTSVAIPPAATYHWWVGRWRARHVCAPAPACDGV